MTTPAIDHILGLAHQLSREQRRLLVTRLEQELAIESSPARSRMTPDEARAAWAQLRESMRDLPMPRMTAGEQLEADRRDRDRALLGRYAESDDVDA